jgi:DNA-binding MarR family transcriptional regulator
MTTTTDALDRLLALHALLRDDMARFEQRHGLTGPRVHLLWVLGATGPSTQAALAQALGVSPRNVTGLVDGLAGSGHVTREAHPGDRRASLVTLTANGQDLVAALQRDHARLADQLFGDLPAERREDLVEMLDDTLGRLRGLVEGGS